VRSTVSRHASRASRAVLHDHFHNELSGYNYGDERLKEELIKQTC